MQARPLLVLFSTHDLDAKVTGVCGNAPEERKRLVQKALAARVENTVFKVVEQKEPDLTLGNLVHDPGMTRFLETAWERWAVEWAREPNDHLKGVFSLDEPTAEGETPCFVAAYAAPRSDGVQVPSTSVLGQVCYFALDRETPLRASTAEGLAWDLAVVRDSVASLIAGDARVVYAQCTHPGHHAGPSSYGGFCFMNQTAVGVKLLRNKFSKVAVIDVDYHHGNGTMAIFWNDPTVFFGSLHGDPTHDYPFNAGFEDQVGPEGPAHGTTRNVPLPGGTEWASYKEALLRLTKEIKAFGPDALVVSLGLDTLYGDPVAYPRSRLAIHPEDFVDMGRILLDGFTEHGLKLPTLVVQEGGYDLVQVPESVANFLCGSPEK